MLCGEFSLLPISAKIFNFPENFCEFNNNNSNSKYMEPVKYYRLSEVEEHKSPHNCWIVINDKVYDISKFLEEHPGGVEVLCEHAGGDATDDYEDVGHSTDARQMADSYVIGELYPEDREKIVRPLMPPGSHVQDSTSWWSNWVIPGLAALVVTVMYRVYTSEE